MDCKWAFKPKFNPDGSFLKPEARLAAKGFQQHPGVGYDETFSPVLKPAPLRFVLTLAVSFK